MVRQLERRAAREAKKAKWVVRRAEAGMNYDLTQRSLVRVMPEETDIERLRELAGDPHQRRSGLSESQRIESVRTCRTVVGPMKEEVQEAIWQRRKQVEFNLAMVDYLERFGRHTHSQEDVVRVPHR
jgi:hypothetical protein